MLTCPKILQVENLLEFYVVGVSLGTAWAHPSSGDTVASVMIGGLRTVLNGAFPIHTNDLICIYFDDERDFFEVGLSCTSAFLRASAHQQKMQDNGGRKPRRILQDDAGNMDLLKVVEWVCHSRLENSSVNNEPTGMAKLKKVIFPCSFELARKKLC